MGKKSFNVTGGGVFIYLQKERSIRVVAGKFKIGKITHTLPYCNSKIKHKRLVSPPCKK